MDLITLAIPFFFLGMGLEALVGFVRRRRVYRAPDVVTNLALGVFQTVIAVVFAGVLLWGYTALYEEHRLFTIEPSPLSWFAVMLGLDFLYYWFHRAAHRVGIAWASHAPHHSSEDYNLAVALRQGPLQPFVSRLFYLPLAFLGFPPWMMATAGALNTLYQFWIHTELVDKLPRPLEWVFNTPSHHRVHHGCTANYLDKNHGGILIVWDRMFGTFCPEGERPVYGTVKPLSSWNPLWATWVPFAEVAHKAWAARGFDRLRAWFMPPEWWPAGAAPDVAAVTGPRAKHDARPAARVVAYVLVMFVVTLALTVGFLFAGDKDLARVVLGAVYLIASFGCLGALLDGARGATAAEAARVVALVPVVWWFSA